MNSGYCFKFAQSGICRFGDSCKFFHGAARNPRQPRSQPRASLNTMESNYTTQGLSSRNGKERKRKQAKKDALDTFFGKYPSFKYNRNAPSSQEFYRMCDHFVWDRSDDEREIAYKGFQRALVEQFNDVYGTDVNDEESWRKLCLALGLNSLPEGLEAMRTTVQSLQVNLVDLVDTWRTGKTVEIFGSLEELCEYTRGTGRYFPKEEAYAGGVLRFLLREISGTYMGHYRAGNKGKGNRRKR